MKLTVALLVLACVQVNAKGFGQQVSLSEHNAPLSKVLKKIEKQTGYYFWYENKLIDQKTKVNLELKNVPLERALEICLANQPLQYSIIDKTIVIREKPVKTNPVPAATAPVRIQVTGSVKDNQGRPLEGVSVVVQGTTRGASTNKDGFFSIEANDGEVLEFSIVGYKKMQVTVGTNSSYNLTMDVEALEGSEVVVVGYGTKKRTSLTGAVSTVGGEVFQSRPIANAMTALQGEIPGVTIQRYAGQPGKQGFEMNVRGASSTNGGNAPLVLIDGVAGNLDLINPNDIESISVLKDAAASIYGARAAGGVMLVTTKKGRKGTPRIMYSGNAAVSKMTGMMKSPSHYEMAVMDNEANIHNGAVPLYSDDYLQRIKNNDPNPVPHPNGYGGWLLFFSSTDWMDALLENGFQQSHNLSLSGGGTNSNYFLSAGYVDQRGVVKYADDNNKRYNLRLNYDYEISKRIRLESKVALENQKRTDIGGVGDWVIGEAIFGMPNHPVYTPDGLFFAQGGWGNAVSYAKEGATSTYNTRGVNTNFKLIADLAKGLKLNVQTGINYRTLNSDDYAKPIPQYKWDGTIQYYAVANPGQSKLTKQNEEVIGKNYTGYLQYHNNFGGKHDFDVMAGVSHEEEDREWFLASVSNVVSDEVPSMGLGTENWFSDGGGGHWALRSAFGRLSYAFDNKYLLEANLRYDGSSRFRKEIRWGFFPGISVGWRISEENFMKSQRIFDDLKLRASYGKVGNQMFPDSDPHLYDYLQLINIGGSYPFGPGRQVPSATISGIASPNRTWETLKNKNIGIDMTVLRSRLGFSFDYFVKNNDNMLIPIAYPSMLGATAPYTNVGRLETKGFETSISWSDRIGKLGYNARFILSDAQNKVLYYGGEDTYVLGLNSLTSWDPHVREGDALNSYYAYVFDGVIRNQKELDDYKQLGGVPSDIGIGDARFKDLNGDGKISLYGDQPGQEGDVKKVGNTTPRFNYGFNLGANFKGFDFALFLQGVGKRTLFRSGDYSMPWSEWWRQPPQFYYGKTWNEDRPDAEFPRLTHGNIRWWNYQASTMQQIDASYIRLKNIQLGYTLPENLTRKIYVNRARIYFSGQDIWEHHNVKGGWDPESADWGGNYPFQRSYSFGLDLTF
ncbi:TonB-dependent receptor [Flavihumibacter solisilvae]|uniref:Collagen-binding protein n=1 Tax=Flavihumibacter solisilvae TaxID=1349421 RepID=A0A0C1L244_9BACT|nr:TonB-dependent receptor [Flavihumibacter solisilvae]KIC94052.1 collagen-binding protein [Flavihumibacter solisilvae]